MIDFAQQVLHLMIRLGELNDAYCDLMQENEVLKAEIKSLKDQMELMLATTDK